MRVEEVMSDKTTMTAVKQAQSEADKPPFPNMVWIPGGTFLMGSDKHYPEEAPAHEVTVDGFWMDQHTVTNEEFRKFVEATKHVTSAERAPKAEDYPGAKPELLVPASVVFNKPRQRVDLRDCYNWWIYVPGANWRHPEGPASSLKGKAKHPVVHVAYEDVEAYAKWIGKELPTEAEWEFAARGGLNGAEFVWAMRLHLMASTWRTRGKVNSPGRTLKKTGSKELRRWDRFHRTVTGSTTWQATFGSGPLTGTRSTRRYRSPAARTLTPKAENETRVSIPTCRRSRSRAK
jgi:formylglycine-generating enzyme required for sulfatase activity